MDFKLSKIRSDAKKYSYVNSRTRERFLTLIELCKACEGNVFKLTDPDFETAGSKYRRSGRSVRRWLKAYLENGPAGLIAKKAKGKAAIPIRGHVAAKIMRYRELYHWGAEVIQKHLEREHGINLGLYRINRYLRKKSLLKRIRRKKQKMHTRKVFIASPGEHTQIDVKYYPHRLERDQKAYVYNFKDHASKWSYKKAYDSFGPSETADFMAEVIAFFPYRIWSVQTDNGVEFTNRFLSHVDKPKEHALDRLLKRHGIRHRLIPPGVKELQGLVERSHREDDEELYHRIRPNTFKELNHLLYAHQERVNQTRLRKPLGWKSANEFLEEYGQDLERQKTEIERLKEKFHYWINGAFEPKAA
jgi:transposase